MPPPSGTVDWPMARDPCHFDTPQPVRTGEWKLVFDLIASFVLSGDRDRATTISLAFYCGHSTFDK